MKSIITAVCLCASGSFAHAQQQSFNDTSSLQPVEVKAIRAGEKAPFTQTTINKKTIQQGNTGQDIPFILNQTPSVVVNSDAGTGIGYTGMRIRGTDATRINVTLNGIPYNDAESQGTFLVNLPDFLSSVNSIQVQRGAGTSSNGTGAFGATVSLSTNEKNDQPYAEINNSYGSFNTWKNTVKAGTGLIDGRYTLDARLSQITSDGYIDRASSNLKAFYLSGAYYMKNSTLRFNIFSGKEKTYQAWNGVPEALLGIDRTYNSSGTDKTGTPYDNETDNYTQTHYQLFFDTKLNNNWNFNTAAFLTRGLGYYENYKAQEKYSKYGLPDLVLADTTITRTDLIRQKWLDNYFYGQVFAAQYKKNKSEITIGGSWSIYDGTHHGDIVWAQYGIDKGYRYYDVTAKKSELNTYIKWQYEFVRNWNLFTDLQYKHVEHKMNGFADNPTLMIKRDFDFINPKAGVSYTNNGLKAYLSYAVANKEPNRDDFEAGLINQPKKEMLQDIELGAEKRTSRYFVGATFYYMQYKDQLVLTGRMNDVGAYTRINVPKSYRAGIELQAGYVVNDWLNASANVTFSKNKIKRFTEFLDEYDVDYNWIGQVSIDHKNTDIAFSPSVVAGGMINILPAKDLQISLISKYVGDQYLDNTESAQRRLNGFYTQDARVIYTIHKKLFKEWNISAQVNNVFSKKYEPNGAVYPIVYDGAVVSDKYYFPMAPVNFVIGLNISL